MLSDKACLLKTPVCAYNVCMCVHLGITLLQVHVMHTDVTHNDWPALFTCAREYAHQAQRSCPELHVTYAGIGGSMFCRNHPSCSVDLGFSLAALHWSAEEGGDSLVCEGAGL
jgi:hypothetical protein